MSVEHLFLKCDRVGRALDCVRAVIVAQEIPGVLMAALAELASCFADLSEHEDSRIYSRLAGDEIVAQIEVSRFSRQARALHRDWLAFLSEWSVDCVEADRETFETQASVFTDRIARITSTASAQLYPFALSKGLLTLRAA